MSFENPINKKVKILEEQLNKSEKNINKEPEVEILNEDKSIISLEEILNKNNTNIEIKMINHPNNSIITGVPRNTFLSLEQLGKLTIKYENSLDNVNKTM